MEKFKFSQEALREEPVANPEATYNALSRKKEKDPLEEFIPEEQAEISNKQQILSSARIFKFQLSLISPGLAGIGILKKTKSKLIRKIFWKNQWIISVSLYLTRADTAE